MKKKGANVERDIFREKKSILKPSYSPRVYCPSLSITLSPSLKPSNSPPCPRNSHGQIISLDDDVEIAKIANRHISFLHGGNIGVKYIRASPSCTSRSPPFIRASPSCTVETSPSTKTSRSPRSCVRAPCPRNSPEPSGRCACRSGATSMARTPRLCSRRSPAATSRSLPTDRSANRCLRVCFVTFSGFSFSSPHPLLCCWTYMIAL